ncbi:prolyl 4-hydroxylase subunit alpha-1-like [Mytilus californianus]|uniref:prolyl 4-hydroxylase subunit alpha-1-like n=1 Tax=Mytilus californianus TaxID=6549 RepID=UPI002245BCF6|nr:prolyl 4-hydroxylase subunit alpha-1-like [Mytilus californianus]
MIFLWNISIVCCLLFHIIHGEIFTSVYKLSILANEEGKLLRAFKKYIATQIRDQRSISLELQRLLNDLESAVTDSSQNPRYAENPINSFHLLGRFIYKWPVVYSNILCAECRLDDAALYLNTTYQIVSMNIVHWPGEYDVKASAQALLRLRTFYYFNIDKAINGILFDEQCQPLNPSQVLKIIRIAIDSNLLNEAKLWCEALLRILPFTSYQDENINDLAINRFLAAIYNQAGMHKKAAGVLLELTQSGYSEVDQEYEFYKNSINETDEKQNIALVAEEYDNHYKQLCRENRKSPREYSKLYCYSSVTSIPYYNAKVEIANLQPKILVFHDVISETEASYLRQEGSKKFTRSTVVRTGNYRTVADSIRISQTAWLYDGPGIAEKTTHRVGLLTGLATKSSPRFSNTEAYQIVNYGIGGMYHPHHDAFEKPLWGPPNKNDPLELIGTGDRIATWMFYLNDVKVGGATVFPNVNARVPVKKGSAAFWYNLLPSGENDHRVLHAGCPVVIGSKWIGNKWIREGGQMLQRPCDLNP